MMKLLQVPAFTEVAHEMNGGTAVIVPPLTGRRVRLGLGLLAALFPLFPYVCAHAAAQFTGGVNLVEVYATVTGADGRPVTDLGAGDFIVEEDGTRQTVETFASGEFPLSVAIGLDRSFSIAPAVLTASVSAVRTFIDRLQLADRVMLVGIGSETEVLAPFEADRADVRRALDRVERWGTTPLFDAVVGAIATVQPAAGRRALILLSDGVDRYSRTTATEMVTEAREHDVLVYPVSIGATRPPIWSEVAAVTGGRSFFARDARGIGPTLSSIAEELRHQYLLGYVPPRGRQEGAPRWRSIFVRVNRPQARVRAREGYLAP